MAQLDPITWFRSAHPEQGSLRVQVSAAQGIFPIPGAAVEVYRDFGAVQPLLPTARTADITDLICNTAGALVGYGLYRPWKKHLRAWM